MLPFAGKLVSKHSECKLQPMTPTQGSRGMLPCTRRKWDLVMFANVAQGVGDKRSSLTFLPFDCLSVSEEMVYLNVESREWVLFCICV